MSERLTCMLCGKTGYDKDVANAMAVWKTGEFGWGPRCRDVWDCYKTVIVIDEEWQLKGIPRRPEGEDLPW